MAGYYGIRELDTARGFYDDGAGLLGVKAGGFYHWYRWDERANNYQRAGSTLTRQGATYYRAERKSP